MKARALALCLLALLVLAPLPAGGREAEKPPRVPSLPFKTKKRIGELFEKYFTAKEEERGAILAEVAALDPIPDSSVKEFTKTLFNLAGKGRRTTGKSIRKLDHPDYPGTFILSGDSGRRVKGLFIGLHGGGEGAGDGKTAAQKWQSAQGRNCICVFPTVIRKEGSAAGLSLMLNEDMVDFGKKVTVVLNGDTVHEDFVSHSAAALLFCIAGRNDRNMVFTARLDL